MPTILVGVDEFPRSQDAVAFALALARGSDARVVIASAFPYEDRPSGGANADYRAALKADSEATALAMARRLEDVSEERVSLRVLAELSPAHALHDLAEAEHADLVVVGSSHTGRLGRVFPGSTAERLLHGSPCAVAVVPLGYHETAHELRRIGAAYDGSEESKAALRTATGLTRAMRAELRVVSVYTDEPVPAPAPTGGADYLALRDEMERRAHESLDRAVRSVPAGVRAERILLRGPAAVQLTNATSDLDLLVTGSRRYGPLRSTLLGGVTGPLLRQAHCTVVVVPRGVEAPLGELFASQRQPAHS